MALTDDLISFWELEEASGTREDAHGTNDLTDNNTVTQSAGKVGNAATFASANSESLSCADNASLSIEATSFTVAFWAFEDSAAGVDGVCGKAVGFGNEEWSIDRIFNGSANVYKMYIRDNGGGKEGPEIARTQDSWQFYVAGVDLTGPTIFISKNNGTPVTAAKTLTISASTAAFVLGESRTNDNLHFNGTLDQFGFWKRVLTGDEITFLYNAGAGRSYADILAAGGGFVAFPRPRGIRGGMSVLSGGMH